MRYQIEDEFGGVPEGIKFQIADTPETEKEWRKLLTDFASEFPEFNEGKGDFEFGDWHHGMRCAFVFLYREDFYTENFIPRVQCVLKNQKAECYGHFECFPTSGQLLGHVMVFKDQVLFSRRSDQTGLLNRLVGSKIN